MKRKQRLFMVWIAVITFIADRLVKIWATGALAEKSADVIHGVLSFSLTKNTGAAFSIFSGNRLPLILATAALMIGIILYILLGHGIGRITATGLWMIVGGGIGNLYDRIAFGSVIDFIKLDFIRFAVFNVADICVCVGCALAVAGLLIDDYKERKKIAE